MDFLLICRYCDHRWELTQEALKYAGYPKCDKCGDENITIKELAKSKIDAYQGCPEFEYKEESGNIDIEHWFQGD